MKRIGPVLVFASVILLAVAAISACRWMAAPVETAPAPLVQTAQKEVQADSGCGPSAASETKQESPVPIQTETEIPASHKENFYNILVVGTDGDGTRTDTIMIAGLDIKSHTAALLSIPRDTIIDSQMTVPKINGVYGAAGKGEKGIQNLKAHLAKLLGFEVDAYAVVDLDVFVELVDLAGGVEFDVPMRMHYADPAQDLYIDLQPGVQRLDGQHAMQLVRFRKGYATQDLQRTQVQQQFLRALAKQCLSLKNLTKLSKLAELFSQHVDTDLTLGNMIYFGQELLKCDFDQMTTYTLEGEGVMLDGISYYAVYRNKTLEMINRHFNPYDREIAASDVTILTPEYIRSLQPEETETAEPEGGASETEALQTEEPVPAPEADPPYETEQLPTDQWVETSAEERSAPEP